jgi:hypothetical protein
MRNEKEEKVWEALPRSWGELGNLFLFSPDMRAGESNIPKG